MACRYCMHTLGFACACIRPCAAFMLCKTTYFNAPARVKCFSQTKMVIQNLLPRSLRSCRKGAREVSCLLGVSLPARSRMPSSKSLRSCTFCSLGDKMLCSYQSLSKKYAVFLSKSLRSCSCCSLLVTKCCVLIKEVSIARLAH